MENTPKWEEDDNSSFFIFLIVFKTNFMIILLILIKLIFDVCIMHKELSGLSLSTRQKHY